jgi:murein DD-endopeptidase MepM/ murein hydrolase activator NlpD
VKRPSWPGRGASLVAIAGGLLVTSCNFSGRPPPAAVDSVGLAQASAPDRSTAEQPPGIYRVIPGDTVYGVAQRFAVSVRTLIESNGLKPPFRLAADQRLKVPVREEHVVQRGETLFAISRIYGLDQSSLARVNKLQAPFALEPGQRLILPGRVAAHSESVDTPERPQISSDESAGAITIEALPTPDPVAATPTAPSTASIDTPIPQEPSEEPPATQPDSNGTAALPEAEPGSAKRFLWPVEGEIVSRFGPKKGGLHNDGINIAAPAGTSVVAADDGVVAYAGNELRGFGNLLLVRHDGGWVTAYAHNDKLLVKRGDKVKRGQTIARIGSTGNVASPQLHFEIRQGTDPVDPLRYLGAQRAQLNPAVARGGRPDPG